MEVSQEVCIKWRVNIEKGETTKKSKNRKEHKMECGNLAVFVDLHTRRHTCQTLGDTPRPAGPDMKMVNETFDFEY